jgi:hypothetical protein
MSSKSRALEQIQALLPRGRVVEGKWSEQGIQG